MFGIGGIDRAVLLCQPSPAALFRSHITGGGGLWVFFSQPHPHCVLPSHMLTLFPIISPSVLSPDLDSHGVRFKARWTERFFSPMIVVLLTSRSWVLWENSGAEVPIVFQELEGSLVDISPKNVLEMIILNNQTKPKGTVMKGYLDSWCLFLSYVLSSFPSMDRSSSICTIYAAGEAPFAMIYLLLR